MPLRGTTWDHPRGWSPLVALASTDPELAVRWDVRSLVQFGAQSLADLADTYDLLVLDHPFIGEGASQGLLCPLDELLDPVLLVSVRAGHDPRFVRSYSWMGRLYALPIDAACHVGVVRPDLVPGPLPPTWQEVLAVARTPQWREHMVTALGPVDAWCAFLTLCASQGQGLFINPVQALPAVPAARSMTMLRDLAELGPSQASEWTPIDVLERMSTGDDIWASPLLFGYAPYERPGFRLRGLRFERPPGFPGQCCRPLVGGAGIAVSARSGHQRDAALAALRLGTAEIQLGGYRRADGQPAHPDAWREGAEGFFARTAAALADGFIRPTFEGFADYQARSFAVVHEAIWRGADIEAAINHLNRDWERMVKGMANDRG
jgi:multiple sugar transport system substrate-binding protein